MVWEMIQVSLSLDELIENEWYTVRYSGEIPEIAYNSAIFFLTISADGPRVELSESQTLMLKEAALERYKEIVVRDLEPQNFDKTVYRGIGRSICNYTRFCDFCARQKLDRSGVRSSASVALFTHLKLEAEQLKNKVSCVSFNCTYKELIGFAAELGVELQPEFESLQVLCQQE